MNRPKLRTIARGFFRGFEPYAFKTVGDRARLIFRNEGTDHYREIFINLDSGKTFISEEYSFYTEVERHEPYYQAHDIAEMMRIEIIALPGYEVEAFYPDKDFHTDKNIVIIGLRKQGSLICRDLLVYLDNGDVQISDEYSLADFPRGDLPYFE